MDTHPDLGTPSFLRFTGLSAVEIAPATAWRRRVVRIAVFATCGLASGLAAWIVPPLVREARKAQCSEQLSKLSVALLEYEAGHRHYPPAAITDPAGRPLLSWRVAILPQLGLKSLHDRFHLDEPWNSPHNRSLLTKMPPVYACPSLETRGGITGYQVVVGPRAELGSIGTMFEWSRGIDVREVIDGTSNTVMVIETARAVPWTKPDDPSFNRDGPLPEFGSGHPGGFHAVLADGATRFLRSTMVPQTLRALLTRDGNEVLSSG